MKSWGSLWDEIKRAGGALPPAVEYVVYGTLPSASGRRDSFKGANQKLIVDPEFGLEAATE